MNGGEAAIGLYGLGVMGRNLALNMADHGIVVAVYNRTAETTRPFIAASGRAAAHIRAGYTLPEWFELLARPRTVMTMVPAGPPVDAVIQEILPYLQTEDILIDGGNSHFRDTDRRSNALAQRGIHFLGMGVSGGEHGARFGPSLMPGGPLQAYERVRPLLEAISARVDDEPCVAYLGPRSAGHYVKMVHNGIEYGLMQLIAESYDLMKRGLGLDNDELHDIYQSWNRDELNSYLMEITANIFRQKDPQTGGRLIDFIRDRARQKGTGKWVCEEGFELQTPVPTIDAAVAMRDLSAYREEREEISRLLPHAIPIFRGEPKDYIEQFRNALYAGMIITFAQGFHLLRRASSAYGYNLPLGEVARIWRGGCIIRAALLEDIRRAFQPHPDLPHLFLDPLLGRKAMTRLAHLRGGVCKAAELGIPVPALSASLAYFDAYRSADLPAGLIQAQRDYFGAHTYERVDRPGIYHTDWDQA